MSCYCWEVSSGSVENLSPLPLHGLEGRLFLGHLWGALGRFLTLLGCPRDGSEEVALDGGSH